MILRDASGRVWVKNRGWWHWTDVDGVQYALYRRELEKFLGPLEEL